MTTPSTSAQYAVTVRLEYPHGPGQIARISKAIGDLGANIGAIDLVDIVRGVTTRDVSFDASSVEHAEQVVAALRGIDGVAVRGVSDNTFLMHLGGKLEIVSRVQLKTRNDLSMAYTPGVARVCSAIAEDPAKSFKLTVRKNCIAVVSNGTAVLGLGDIGPLAAMPVMEGKAILFKEFGGVDAFPVCIDERDPERVIDLCRAIAPTFGGIDLEDIKAPECFEIEETLESELDIPVFHDDQHGTAVVVLAALINALQLTDRTPADLRVVVAGAGAAGVACSKILLDFGVGELVAADRRGAIHGGREGIEGNPAKEWLAEHTNHERRTGALSDVLRGADMLLGVSGPGIVSRRDIASMRPSPLVFALSNPTPEILPEEIADIAGIVATGRSDYPNQINNVLAFPGIFRGALDARARRIDEGMKLAAAHAIAECIHDDERSADYIIPSVFNRRVAKRVARAVAAAARTSGVASRRTKASALDRI